ncbi:MAG: HEPN domain-containing protein [Oscillospiraceae bacterium]|nr:HEPN domain-containing protein [Oscillospiraceae bacterium]
MKSLIKYADWDMYVCKKIEPDLPDEGAARAVAYHIQQAVEKILKAYISFYGENPPYKHDISQLCDIAERLGVVLPSEAKEIADTLTLWESKARYDPYVSFSLLKYEKAKVAYETLRKNLVIEVSEAEEATKTEDSETCRKDG